MGKSCAFFGHRKIELSVALNEKVKSRVEELIKNGFDNFYFGGFGMFDELCQDVVFDLKKTYPNIKTVFCVLEEKNLRKTRLATNQKFYEYVCLSVSFDWWYTKIYYRNIEIINLSDYLIFYAKEDENSGAYKALKYAKLKRKEFINLYN